jgi:hypothetical protein
VPTFHVFVRADYSFGNRLFKLIGMVASFIVFNDIASLINLRLLLVNLTREFSQLLLVNIGNHFFVSCLFYQFLLHQNSLPTVLSLNSSLICFQKCGGGGALPSLRGKIFVLRNRFVRAVL